jgi:hypothetical protein
MDTLQQTLAYSVHVFEFKTFRCESWQWVEHQPGMNILYTGYETAIAKYSQNVLASHGSPFSEANESPSQKYFPAFQPKVHYRVYKSQMLVHILSQRIQSTSSAPMTHFSIIVLSAPR